MINFVRRSCCIGLLCLAMPANAGTDNLAHPLDINLNSSALPAPVTGSVLRVGNADATVTRVEANAFGSQAYFMNSCYGGTNASPSALTVNTECGGYQAYFYNGTTLVGPLASIGTFAAENQSSGHGGSFIRIATTPTGSTTPATVAQFENNGGLALGIGYAGTNVAPANGLIVQGYTGIGTTSPTAPFHVDGIARVNELIIGQTTNTYNGSIEVTYNDLTNYGIYFNDTNTGTPNAPVLSFQRNGGIVGTVEIDNTGTTYNTTSDRRLKKDIVDTAMGLTQLMQIKVRDYGFKSDGEKANEQGFIAQELYEVYPFAVAKGDDDIKKKPWGVDYGRVTPLLTKAIQELKIENDNLKSANVDLQARLAENEKAIIAIQAKLGLQ